MKKPLDVIGGSPISKQKGQKKPAARKGKNIGVTVIRDPGSADIWIHGYKTYNKREELKSFMSNNFPENKFLWDAPEKRWVLKCDMYSENDVNFQEVKRMILEDVFGMKFPSNFYDES